MNWIWVMVDAWEIFGDQPECKDCGMNLAPGDEGWEWYMLQPDVWAQTGLGIHEGCLCIGCVEKRIGRKLHRRDFTSAWVNDLTHFHSERLLDRMAS